MGFEIRVPGSPLSESIVAKYHRLMELMDKGSAEECDEHMVSFLGSADYWLVIFSDSGGNETILRNRRKALELVRDGLAARNIHVKEEITLPEEESSYWLFFLIGRFLDWDLHPNMDLNRVVFQLVCAFLQKRAEDFALRLEIIQSLLEAVWGHLMVGLVSGDAKFHDPAYKLVKAVCKHASLSSCIARKLVESRVNMPNYSCASMAAFRRERVEFLRKVAHRCIALQDQFAPARTCFKTCLQELKASQDAELEPVLQYEIRTSINRLEKSFSKA